MKKIMKLMLMFAIVPTLLFTSCEKSEDEANEFLELKTYLTDNSLDLGAIIGDKEAGTFFVMAATDETSLDGKYLVDIRDAATFAAGHIAGAKNVAFADIKAEAAAASDAGKTMVIVCVTGQTACYATSLCRLAGFPNVKALKWGMSGWNGDTDVWSSKTGEIAKDHANWSTDAEPSLEAYGLPTVITGAEGGAAILEAQVDAVIADGFGAATVAGSAVLEAPADYFVNNFFPADHYTGFGHIAGAKRIKPLGLSNIDYLDAGETVVTYCYTGQTSAVITAYLRVLGYDAKSLLFGMNGLYNSNPFWTPEIGNQWGYDSMAKDFPLAN